MPALATPDDVALLWRPLTGTETDTAAALLARVSAMVRTALPGIDARIAADPNLRELATGVVVDAVLRVLRNPEGYTSEQIGAYSYSRDTDGTAGLYLSDAEWALLRPASIARGAFTVRPGPGR